MGKYQDVSTEQEDVVQPRFPKQPPASREQQRTEQDVEKQLIIGEKHRIAVLKNGGKGSVFLNIYELQSAE